nr:MAG TPA: lipoprotein [Caudoviricetes sp.]DAN90748.1 MAG TPA: lipoprotein [Bacteriophage sp.]DAW00129.1 MAG TPA: lipoprotein [Caudoviricetes sp.]DAX07448.1 MAG TPA: lipoprotein [Bacteriophage sp.]DAY37285.1 MAG TPA: lipoprotein [Bacteriophage sp.]
MMMNKIAIINMLLSMTQVMYLCGEIVFLI